MRGHSDNVHITAAFQDKPACTSYQNGTFVCHGRSNKNHVEPMSVESTKVILALKDAIAKGASNFSQGMCASMSKFCLLKKDCMQLMLQDVNKSPRCLEALPMFQVMHRKGGTPLPS